MKPVKKLVATVGKYTDQSGQEKNRYQRMGTMFKRDDGTFALKIEAVPVEFNGWVNFYDLDPPKEQQPPPAPVAPVQEMPDDDIPF